MKITQLETDLRAKQQAAKTLLETTMRACQEHVVTPATATAPAVLGRVMTGEERAAVQALLDEAKAIKARIDGAANDAALMGEITRLTGGEASARTPAPARRRRSPGQQVMDSPMGEWLRATAGKRSRGWTSPSVEIEGFQTFDLYGTTLTSDPASGGDLIVPDYRPGIVAQLFRPIVIADLIAPGTTDSNLVTFMRELPATNAAAPVAEGAAKPESTLVFDVGQAPVRKIATWLPVTDEMLEDVPAITSFIDSRLRLFIQLVEDDQLLNGDGVAPNILGIRATPGLTPDVVRGTDTNADAIFKQITAIATAAYITPDAIAMHPTNWQTTQLAKDTTGSYLGAGPFIAPELPRLWGLPVAVTVAMTVGVALPGAYRTGAQFFRKGGLRVDASNSHSDFFIKNLTAIRAEERGALTVYRPAGFGEVTGLN